MKDQDFLLESYDYDLPKELIATQPSAQRSDSRLLVYNMSNQEVTHSHFRELHRFLPKESVLVRNTSKVFPCRVLAKKLTGGQAELFFLSLEPSTLGYPCLIKSRGKKKIGDGFTLGPNIEAKITELCEGQFRVQLNIENEKFKHYIMEQGEIPLPPYMNRQAHDEDQDRYQTVYAQQVGSVAAPTAGLHFDETVFKNLEAQGCRFVDVTLHVGLGTFKPVEVPDIRDHKMHGEYFEVTPTALELLNQKREKLIAVGTTSLRVLESAINEQGKFDQPQGQTTIFLYPGRPVRSIEGLITNFHLPQSSLLMLISALIGREKTMELYQMAIEEKYRFYSYGDAMLILR